MPEVAGRNAPEAAAALRRRHRQRLETLRAVALGVGFPVLFDNPVGPRGRDVGTRLIPSPYQVAVMMYDFSFGGVYDDAFSGTILIHVWKSGAAGLCRVFPCRLDRHPLGHGDRTHQGAAAIAGPDHLAAAADPGHRMAAAVDDLFRPRAKRGNLPGVSRGILSDPAEHHVRGPLDRSAPVRGGFDARLLRHGDVSPDRAARLFTRNLQRTADRIGKALPGS